jgi:hypothetical protein
MDIEILKGIKQNFIPNIDCTYDVTGAMYQNLARNILVLGGYFRMCS